MKSLKGSLTQRRQDAKKGMSLRAEIKRSNLRLFSVRAWILTQRAQRTQRKAESGVGEGVCRYSLKGFHHGGTEDTEKS